MQQKTRWMAICLAAGLCAATAGATTITSLNTSGYTWMNEISGTQTDTTLLTSSPWISNGFSVTSPNNDVSNKSLTVFSPHFQTFPGLTTDNSHEMTITAPLGGETAVLLNLYNYAGGSGGGGTLNVTLSDSETFTTSYSPTFWFSSSDSIAWITIASGFSNNQPFIASLSYATSILAGSGSDTGTGTTSPIPEPATILLVSAGGLIFLGARRRWFRHQA